MVTPRAPLWLASASRYAGISKTRARIVLASLIALIVVMTPFRSFEPPQPLSPAELAAAEKIGRGETDLALYEAIVDAVRHGGDYYIVTADALRASPGYPLRPFVTFRPPLLAEVQAHLPAAYVFLLLWGLVAATWYTWTSRLSVALPDPVVRGIAALLLLGGLAVSVQPALIASHEVWAALLIAWSLALRRPGRWVEAISLAVIAMLIRETAALYVVVMAAIAWIEGERREAAGWVVALGVFAVALAAHALAVSQVVRVTDPASDGWAGLSGLEFFAVTLKHATVLEVFPFVAVAPVIALALFGWTAWRDPLATRMTVMLVGYGFLIALFARHNNFYWGLMAAPVFLAGLVFVPDALRDLIRAALDRRRITVTRTAR